MSKELVTCKKHGDFKVEPEAHLKGEGCPVCDRIQIDRVLGQWYREWFEVNDEGLVMHPELIFRITGSGWSWVKLADTSENIIQDYIENKAFELFSEKLKEIISKLF